MNGKERYFGALGYVLGLVGFALGLGIGAYFYLSLAVSVGKTEAAINTAIKLGCKDAFFASGIIKNGK